jgi:hypothetical protein
MGDNVYDFAQQWQFHPTCLGSSLNEGEGSVCLTSLYYLFYMTFFSNENIVYMLYKTSYLNEEVSSTEPSPLRIPCLG